MTRPTADAERTAAALRDRGHEPIVAPLLDIEIASDAALGAGPWGAILVTSANAVRAIALHRRRDELRRIPTFAVGDRTGQAMRETGFTEVSSAAGDVSDLAKLVAARVAPEARLLYLAGEERSGDLAGLLRARHYTVETVLIYRAVIAEQLPRHAAAAVATGIDGVLHFSRRSAEAYVTASRNAGLLETALERPVHFCLSARVAEPLRRAGATTVRIAARPDEAALIELCG
ncbi:MAG TPA: uroporphyrinogen-III synthase [Xanthobacteraceae bacterium]